MTPQQFIAKWETASLSERSACQQHFLDLCDLIGVQKPAEADPHGEWYTFEYGVTKTKGGHGWADVWMRGHFGWEYKGKHKNLAAAYDQLLQYREALENPPLLVVCDLNRFEVHTNFTGTIKRVHAFDLAGLEDPHNLDVLRRLFTDPQSLKPGETPAGVTEHIAGLFGHIADALRERGVDASAAAHFLMKLMFCMFAEDVGLLTREGKLFSRVLRSSKSEPQKLSKNLRELFTAMSEGGDFWGEDVLHFNGGLFADAEVIDLLPDEIQKVSDANIPDWSNVEPSVFGTLFERTLDPNKRSQIGAHYTSRADIETLLEPVVMQPLRREWADVKAQCEAQLSQSPGVAPPGRSRRSKKLAGRDKLLRDFVERLSHVTILDPACGSGNFLYVALHLLLDLEKEVISYAAKQGVGLFPHVRPTQLAGIEINPYAQELASVVIWIGYLQWMRHNGFNPPNNPVLEPIESIRRMDAILDLSDPEHPLEPEWPEAEFIVGNPPFLGDKFMRGGLGDPYVDALRQCYADRLPSQTDLCTYWFEKARHAIAERGTKRAGLLATQAIRGGKNRDVLARIKESGDIFFAESDREWILEGANVHVSIIAFDDRAEKMRFLDRNQVDSINANLTSATDITTARRLPTNESLAFIGLSMHGPFDFNDPRARTLLEAPVNPVGCPNSDVVRPILNSAQILKRLDDRWAVCFSPESKLQPSAQYEGPFEYVREHVQPIRNQNRRGTYRDRWWVFGEARPALWGLLERLPRFIGTPRIGKHRVFFWIDTVILPSDQIVSFVRSDDYFFGVLHSHAHELWALKLGTRLETRPRYTPTTCFETFPFPEPNDAQREAIAGAARELDQLRENWLNPAEWTRTEVLEFPGSVGGPWDRYIDPASVRSLATSPTAQIGTVRYPRIVAKDEDAAKQLKKRTLTNLYNDRPTWLDLAHRKLDEAVFAAYGWDAGMSDDELLGKLLELNLARATV